MTGHIAKVRLTSGFDPDRTSHLSNSESKPHIHATVAEPHSDYSQGSQILLTAVHPLQVISMRDVDIRAALERHWAASDASDFEMEHEIYCEEAILDYPQSGERIRGRRQIQFSRAAQPNKKRFNVKRILGTGDLWITEFVLTYDGQPSYVVSIMEFHSGQVAHETQYFGDAFEPGPSRAQWVEPMR
jgi:hypothetical protein